MTGVIESIVLTLSVIFIYSVHIGDCCLCFQRNPTDLLSHADFAIKVQVTSDRYERQSNSTHKGLKQMSFFAYYDVLVTKIFKGNILSQEATFANFFTVTLKTPNGDALCGVRFKQGVSYLITGQIINNEMQIQQCNWIEPYHMVSEENKSLLLATAKSNKVAEVIVDSTDNESINSGYGTSSAISYDLGLLILCLGFAFRSGTS